MRCNVIYSSLYHFQLILSRQVTKTWMKTLNSVLCRKRLKVKRAFPWVRIFFTLSCICVHLTLAYTGVLGITTTLNSVILKNIVRAACWPPMCKLKTVQKSVTSMQVFLKCTKDGGVPEPYGSLLSSTSLNRVLAQNNIISMVLIANKHLTPPTNNRHSIM